ncbi:AraC family transcriptional regulator [Halieaceae bacterium IMCC14734]|uniref:AraC family transcriptional regulator n=1 Tax=Candidatus Litorirhabdus singularis TaxID=2518993 RepID=A0ABT3TBA8_9GAMM|nr:helix-turn-helix transcriptional regulator [Candidatus Litorirhabdus singularis]MCX2979573.1 AraC family transcriptional regulator [Candidatus Litorirhabdus singularis]
MRQNQYSIQIMRPALLLPFVLAMDKHKMDTDILLEQHRLTRSSVMNDTGMISAQQVHPFLRSATDASGDPGFCWRVGWQLDHNQYPMFSEQLARGLSLAELLTEMALSAENLASASRFELQIPGAYASFTELRLYKSNPSPHTDAFFFGALSSLLKGFVKQHWDQTEVSAELADLSAVPHDTGSKLVQTQLPSKCTISFPTIWLLPKGSSSHFAKPNSVEFETAGRLVEFLRSALHPYLDTPGMTAEAAANRIDSPLREINESLKPRSTTLAQLLDDWRLQQACRKLRNTDLSVADVGSAVGYPDPTSFSRAFRRWTGMSPRDYRNSSL